MSGCHIPGRFFESELGSGRGCRLVPFTDLTKIDDQHRISHIMAPPEGYLHVSNLACTLDDEYLQYHVRTKDELDWMLVR